MDTGKILLGVLAGVAAGALLGVLLAPEKGSTTRRNISKKGDEYVDDVKETFNEFLDGVTEKIAEVKLKAKEFVGNGVAKVEDFKAN
jgi:gas vesicle protein